VLDALRRIQLCNVVFEMRRKHHPVTIALIDLDHFKRFNDTWRHDAGDLVLKTMAQVFRAHFLAEDVIGWYGGEEFSVISAKLRLQM
jgi:diguanylate cyclase (GGDEF)-like protein